MDIPRYHQRAFAHNYHAPFIYHIILKKLVGVENFGIIKGDARIRPGDPGSPYVEESLLGRTISKAIFRLQYAFPVLQIYRFAIMPDHVHILLRVKDWTEKHLDHYIYALTENIATAYSYRTGRKVTVDNIFQPGYCDKPLLRNRSLDMLYRYIRENPYRLAVRRQFPQFFQRVRKLRIGDTECRAYGNLFLLRNPDKAAVKISSKFSPEETAQKKAAWLYNSGRGTILVSPFISPAEKAIRTEAEARGANIILITHEAIGDRFKPADHDFALCTQGRLLIIAPILPGATTLTRAICLRMNALAEDIAALDATFIAC
ncbi:MAG: hypothetical protein HDS69_03060 [Bacteroidales bacterium]|nr:hypothetical protein [Bacteroidales bacterium]